MLVARCGFRNSKYEPHTEPRLRRSAWQRCAGVRSCSVVAVGKVLGVLWHRCGANLWQCQQILYCVTFARRLQGRTGHPCRSLPEAGMLSPKSTVLGLPTPKTSSLELSERSRPDRLASRQWLSWAGHAHWTCGSRLVPTSQYTLTVTVNYRF